MTKPDTILTAKADLRGEMMRRRAQMSAGLRDSASRKLGQHDLGFVPLRAGAVITAYAAIGEELDPLPLLTKLADRGHPIGLPVTAGKDKPLIFRRWHPGEALEKSSFGLRVPRSGSPELTPDILLVPLLAFDRHGMRLGYGGGYYDRTLTLLRAERAIVAIGLAFDEQRVENVPHADYDQRLDWVLTPSGPVETERE